MASDPTLGGKLRARRNEQRARRAPLPPLFRSPSGLLGLEVGAGLELVGAALAAQSAQIALARYNAVDLPEGSNTSGAGDYFITADANRLEPQEFTSSAALAASSTEEAIFLPAGEYAAFGLMTMQNDNVADVVGRLALTNATGTVVYDSHTNKTVYGQEFAPTNLAALFSLPSPDQLYLRGAKPVGETNVIELDRGYLFILRLGEAV